MGNTQTGVIIAAAGTGSRMGEGPLKQLRLINGKPLLTHAIEVFERHEEVTEIVVAAPADALAQVRAAILPFGFGKISAIVPGGENRQDSVRLGLYALSRDTKYVLIHDAARPFLAPARITDLLRRVAQYGAASLGVRPKDTVKIASADGQVKSTLPRENLWLVQTPQGFDYELILRAHEAAAADGFIGTDDAVLAERLGARVRMVEGDYGNIKITTPEDLPGNLPENP